jgi:hypothetical protein
MNNGNREFLHIHLRRGNSCSTCPSLSLSRYCLSCSLCVVPRTPPIASFSSVFAASAQHYARFFFFFFFFFLFFIPPPSPLFAPFLFVNQKSQLALSFSLFLYFYLFYFFFFGGGVVETWEIVEELTLEDVVLGFFLFVLCCSRSRLWELGFFSFPVLTCELLLFGGELRVLYFCCLLRPPPLLFSPG